MKPGKPELLIGIAIDIVIYAFLAYFWIRHKIKP